MSRTEQRAEPRVSLAEVRQRLQSRLQALDLDGATSPGDQLFVLSELGDALRAGAELPVSARRWLEAREPQALESVAAEAIARVEACRTLAAGSAEPAVELVSRDRAESARVALVRMLFGRLRLFPALRALFERLDAALNTFDTDLRSRWSRVDVERSLRWRVALQPAWADAFEPGDVAPGGFVPGGAGRTWLASGPPTDTSVFEYLRHGSEQREVEGAARADADFADDLAHAITGAIDDRLDTSLVARRWLRGHEPGRPGVFDLSVLPGKRLAAASRQANDAAANGAEPRWVRLGVLSPLDAEASLRITHEQVTFCVYPGSDTVVRVQVNRVAVMRPAPEGHWEVSLPLEPSSPQPALELQVSGEAGVEFRERLQLTPEV